MTTTTALVTGAAAALLALGAAAPAAASGPGAPLPVAPTAERAAAAPETLATLGRFFARDGALARTDAAPRISGASVPVRILSADFVAGKPGAPVAREEFRASLAVAADGQKASLWTVRSPAGWQVVNIATGDDELRYAREGARRLPGGLVFREPQIDAWYVQKGTKVLPLDEDAVRAVGRNGTTLAAYRDRVTRAYADKLPGSAYARKGAAGGYAPEAPGSAPAAAAAGPTAPAEGTAAGGPRHQPAAATAASTVAAFGAVAALALIGATALRRRAAGRRTQES
ncbi:hypothetical protein HHL19_05220 [Streptomyces sp. R302]|uniref:hypothetical protein n=1 Tax=unclassified Streptomyces TaxID=2593676 RepID=UPI00145CBD61|nr:MULTISPECIES: hypothetical protein [unclassified Streptomyces]NML49749.1 hypothetical protein [Streptomyces sp. R301]NML78076.1 hypothetical protein [Streptomyces sp. R302]